MRKRGETGRNKKKQEETGRNRKKRKEAEKNGKKQAEMGGNRKRKRKWKGKRKWKRTKHLINDNKIMQPLWRGRTTRQADKNLDIETESPVPGIW